MTHTVRTIEMSVMGISTSNETKTKRIPFRATPKQERLIKVAAKSQGVNVTDLILRVLARKPEQTLADKTHISSSMKSSGAFS